MQNLLTAQQLQAAGISEEQARYALDLLDKVAQARGESPTITCPSEVVPLLADIKDRQREHFVVFYLNARMKVLHRETLSIGSLCASIVHPRELFSVALKLDQGVASVVLAHNHPSGEVSPSKDDIELTRRLVKAGEILGIEVMDHIIIASTEFVSLKEKGLM